MRLGVPRHVAVKLGVPIVGIGLRPTCATPTIVLVPEAAMDEHNRSPAWKGQVGAARQIAPVQSEAMAHTVRKATHGQFWACVLRFDRLHDATALLGRVRVHRLRLAALDCIDARRGWLPRRSHPRIASP